MKKKIILSLTVLFIISCACAGEKKLNIYDIYDKEETPEAIFPDKGDNLKNGVTIGNALSGFRVRFTMLDSDKKLYIAYYDGGHNMMLATYDKETGVVDKVALPSRIGWDSHNYIAMAFDADGYLHLSGNMHCSPLVYFRSAEPYDIHSMKPVHTMSGASENAVTYPSFMTLADGRLIFHYRTGGSGNGNEIYNIYDGKSRSWSRFLDKPLIDGKNQRNAYMQGPVKGPDGRYHLAWVWRESSDCSTNHTLSYARSADLKSWESVTGEKVGSPILLEQEELYVDPTPVKGGLFNPAVRLAFDSEGHPVIGYMKYDEDGNNQLYVATTDEKGWKLTQLTDWDYRWAFGGEGSIQAQILIDPLQNLPGGKMAFPFSHIKYGEKELVFDENTLIVEEIRPVHTDLPSHLLTVESDFPGMMVHNTRCGDYILHWESLPSNRDRKPAGTLPPPSTLKLYKLFENEK